jgi:hypothetical protein
MARRGLTSVLRPGTDAVGAPDEESVMTEFIAETVVDALSIDGVRLRFRFGITYDLLPWMTDGNEASFNLDVSPDKEPLEMMVCARWSS